MRKYCSSLLLFSLGSDKVTFSHCGKYLVSVTNTNIVAIWRREVN